MSKILMTRRHRHYAARIDQLRNNLLAIDGGRPYIDARLHRAPNESDVSWEGSGTEAIPGRRLRAYLVNDAGRVSSKIEQYLFSKDAKRDSIDKAFESDTTTTGLSVNVFWREVCTQYTGGQWVWLHADRGAPVIDPETGIPTTRTVAQREAAGDRVYWSIWPSTDVVDWCFDASGKLKWLLAADRQYINADPMVDAKDQAVRILWQRGEKGQGATWARYIENKQGGGDLIASGSISVQDLPWILLGIPTSKPWWFDDVEMIQCALLNIGSLNHENLVKTVFPQLVVPASMIEGLEAKLVERIGMDKGSRVTEVVREIIRGMDRPFVESSEDNGLTRYLQPSNSELKALPEEEDRRRKQLFDIAGLALFNRESRQVQTAESKQFDHLDTASTLRNRAHLLQEAEEKLVALSKALDTSFAVYEPVWPQDFDIPNTSEDVMALTQLANFTELPGLMKRQILKAALKLLDQIEGINDEDRKAILEEIEAMTVDGPEID
jgi:hypothetical protein